MVRSIAVSYTHLDVYKRQGKKVAYITAMPRMARYLEVSATIYAIYLKYLAAHDIHIYSIDEAFMELTPYLHLYGKSAHELVVSIIRDVLWNTGITATGGIGTNLYLAKIAMDITAKHLPADKDGDVYERQLQFRGHGDQLVKIHGAVFPLDGRKKTVDLYRVAVKGKNVLDVIWHGNLLFTLWIEYRKDTKRYFTLWFTWPWMARSVILPGQA